MQENLVGHHILKRDLQTNQTLYEALLARMKEASVASTMIASNVAVIRRAETPHLPIKPKPVKYMALALIIGAMAGIMAALFVEYLDSSIKTTEEMERLLHIAVLGVVPLADSKELQSQTGPLDLITHNDSRSMVSEAVFHIRTAIMLSASAAPPRVITITSANPQEGKSTISSNIAAVLATKDRKCLLMDCDLRKPRLHRVFGMSNKCGLTNYLTGNASLEEVIRPTVVPNLYFIPGGPNPPNPNELFASTAFKELMDKMRLELDHIVIDSPPVIGFADARSISGHTDGVVLVIRHHETTREAGRLALQLLSQNNCRVLGSVLSMARADRLGYGGYYGYYRYYHKYYSGYHESDNGNKNKQVTDS
jgi:capsular exopolysaccharide synthesis family protein